MQVKARQLFPRSVNNSKVFFLLLALVCLSASTGSAQSGGGVDSTGTGGLHTIQGRIYFPSGRRNDARIRVKLQSVNSGELSVFSDTNGGFTFRGLEPGSYAVVVDAGDDYEVARESVYIEGEVDVARRRGITVPRVPKIFTVDVSLRLKQEVYVKAGVVNAALAAVPEPARELYFQALASAEAGEPAKAITQLKAALNIHPDFPIALNELGVQYLRTSQADKAAESLSKAVKLAPNDFQPRLNYGIALLNLRQLPEAEEQLRFATSKQAGSPTAHMYLGIALAIQRKLDEGQKELEAAIATKSQEVFLAHRYLSGIYLERHQYALAANELESYLKLVPKAPDAERLRQKIKELRGKG